MTVEHNLISTLQYTCHGGNINSNCPGFAANVHTCRTVSALSSNSYGLPFLQICVALELLLAHKQAVSSGADRSAVIAKTRAALVPPALIAPPPRRASSGADSFGSLGSPALHVHITGPDASMPPLARPQKAARAAAGRTVAFDGEWNMP